MMEYFDILKLAVELVVMYSKDELLFDGVEQFLSCVAC